ncbi:hypothetical protein CPLU01_08190 [Colletotrichum plurivorum]|uniref:Beta-lactamase-related domain-containing protein n=1 Tax=Colletotrichum plurivorum TaxID=2175906 RepID=A0A8H6KD84_9PEZI|nr:hypothetical protein CPLU01_08190 [Colletotrichum plurivorum]
MAPGSVQERLDAIEPVIRRICAVAGTPGISVWVSYRGEIAHRANYGFADIEAQSATTSDTVYPIGTMAKALTATRRGVIETLSGMSFGRFLEEKLLRPLGMSHTSFDALPGQTDEPGLAKPYAAMDDASAHLMPFPPVHDGTIMAPAMGGRSSADDLLRYSMALLAARCDEASGKKADVIRHAVKQLSGHIFTAPGTLEKSYAFGFYRTQLPNTVLGMGWNSIYVDRMPTLIPRGHAGPVIAHGGSLPGHHVAMALLPELDSSVVVCTNSIAPGDVGMGQSPCLGGADRDAVAI